MWTMRKLLSGCGVRLMPDRNPSPDKPLKLRKDLKDIAFELRRWAAVLELYAAVLEAEDER